jgi:putative transposase
MKVTRTASVKLDVSPQESQILLQTLEAYTNAYNFCCSTGFQNNTKNGIVLHQLTYQSTRDDLPSQLAISARMVATESLKSVFSKKKTHPNKTFKCPSSKRTSVRLDKNSHTIWFEKSLVSILTTQGRLRLPFKINKYFSQYINWKHTSCTLSFKKNKFFLNVVFEKDVADVPKSGKYLGIDRGIRKLAVTSNNKFYAGGQTRRVCQRYQNLRNKLQKCGSRSAKRHLVRLSGREQRFKADINHQISKSIVSELNPGDTIVLEALSGIRNKRMRKKQRKEVNSWNYYQLETFLTYKALAKSIHIEYVDARYTSQRCSKCGYIKRSNRKSQSDFRCGKCGFRLNADLNAARNIVLKHLDSKAFYESRESDRAEVNQPNVRLAFGEQGTSLQASPVGS